MTWLYLLKTKDEVANVFEIFQKVIQTQFGKNIKFVRSDNGGEFVNKTLKDFFANEGIIHETSCAGKTQQNGVAERKNQHIMETTQSLLFEYSVPERFWDDAIMAAVHLINRMPSVVLKISNSVTKSLFFLTIPSILTLPPRIFGCMAYVHVPKNQRTKINPSAEKCIFLGYGLQKKGYKCYNPISKRVYVTRDVTFLEIEGYYQTTKIHFQEESNHGENIFLFAANHGENGSPTSCANFGPVFNSGPTNLGPDPDSGPVDLCPESHHNLGTRPNAEASSDLD